MSATDSAVKAVLKLTEYQGFSSSECISLPSGFTSILLRPGSCCSGQLFFILKSWHMRLSSQSYGKDTERPLLPFVWCLFCASNAYGWTYKCTQLTCLFLGLLFIFVLCCHGKVASSLQCWYSVVCSVCLVLFVSDHLEAAHLHWKGTKEMDDPSGMSSFSGLIFRT